MANLTTKELDLLKAQLGEEKNLIAKYKMYSAVTADPVLKEQLSTIASKHEAHYDKLLTLLA